jgi:hypothetical protein
MGNTATYDPQPVTTAPEDWSRGIAAAEISLGFGAGVASGLLPGGAVVEQIGTSVGLDQGWIEPHPDLQLGIALGQIFGGLARVVQGGLMIKGGAALSATGVGAIAGVPAIAVGATWAVAGTANILAGIDGLTTALSSGSGPAAAMPGPTRVAQHHIFPQQFRKFFASKGVDIDKYTVSIAQETTHLKGVHGRGLGNMPGGWNARWAEFIDKNPNATAAKIYQFGGKLMDEFGLSHLPIAPY